MLETLTWTCDQLTAAGVAAVIDPRDLVIPGAWVTITGLDVDTLDHSHQTVTVAVTLVAADTGLETAIDQLASMVKTTSAALDQAATWSALTIRLPNHAPDPLPALRASIEIGWTDDNDD